MKKIALGITIVLLAIFLCGCSQQPEVVTSQSEEVQASKNSDGITDEDSSSFSDSESASDKPAETASEVVDTTTKDGEQTQKQSQQTASTPQKESEQTATTTKPAETEKPKATPDPEPTPTPTPEPEPTEPPQTFDVSKYVSFAKGYGQEIGLSLDSTANACWDNPLIASTSSTSLERDIKNMLDWYKVDGNTSFWVWTEIRSDGKYNLYIGYA